jgi:hypothetical protein
MTPKEKADELFDKYYSVKWHNGKKVCSMSKQAAKDCALIAVDEIINTHLLSEKDIFGTHPVDYWNEVRQEIEKL